MKKLFGGTLILVGACMFAVLFSGLLGLSNMFSMLVDAMSINNVYQWGIFFGTIVMNGILGVIAYFVIKYGLALYREQGVTIRTAK